MINNNKVINTKRLQKELVVKFPGKFLHNINAVHNKYTQMFFPFPSILNNKTLSLKIILFLKSYYELVQDSMANFTSNVKGIYNIRCTSRRTFRLRRDETFYGAYSDKFEVGFSSARKR